MSEKGAAEAAGAEHHPGVLDLRRSAPVRREALLQALEVLLGLLLVMVERLLREGKGTATERW